MADTNDWLTDGKINKMEVDYSATVNTKIPECEALAKVNFSDFSDGYVFMPSHVWNILSMRLFNTSELNF